MRILHTADWHLCNKLGRIDRTADLQARVKTVAELCMEHVVDVLIVAGDLFDDRADLDQITAAFDHIFDTFKSFFQRGGTILAVTGNHDKDEKINMVRTGMALASPFARSVEGRIAGGRMYLNNGRGFATLAGPDGHAVQFVFVPYPFPSRYDLANTEIMAKEELHKALQANVSQWLQKVPTHEKFDVSLPTVLIAHLHVRGSEMTTAYRLTDAEDVVFAFADLNPSWTYVALGHIHKPQMVGGTPHVRYPGSLDRLDITESHDHGAVLFEVGEKQLIGEPQYLPIPATPFHLIPLANLDEELPGLAEKYPDREQAIVKIEIAPHAFALSRNEVERQLRKLFPRQYDVKWIPAEPSERDEAPRVNTKLSLEESVREYLKTNAEFQSDADNVELLKLAECFLSQP